jgi:hypothetical protein
MEQRARNGRETDNAYTSDLAISIGRSECVDPTTCDRYNRKTALERLLSLRHDAHRTHAHLIPLP